MLYCQSEIPPIWPKGDMVLNDVSEPELTPARSVLFCLDERQPRGGTSLFLCLTDPLLRWWVHILIGHGPTVFRALSILQKKLITFDQFLPMTHLEAQVWFFDMFLVAYASSEIRLCSSVVFTLPRAFASKMHTACLTLPCLLVLKLPHWWCYRITIHTLGSSSFGWVFFILSTDGTSSTMASESDGAHVQG